MHRKPSAEDPPRLPHLSDGRARRRARALFQGKRRAQADSTWRAQLHQRAIRIAPKDTIAQAIPASGSMNFNDDFGEMIMPTETITKQEFSSPRADWSNGNKRGAAPHSLTNCQGASDEALIKSLAE